ncbi:hypothetical protein K3H45_09570 [Aeromonas veronii]|uniref:hypothetical protein n=1 Tax=Aeromonas veronii TaxID=654 RepID=UPI001F2BF9CF|nr:hypothetical protein [Aeromonas veronii]MCF5760143.1 hypothetical protein [Aeromonas veronii]
MMACQFDSKTKQLVIAASGFGVLHSPFLAIGMVFLHGVPSSACPVWGGRSWLPTPLNGSVIWLGRVWSAGVELVTFVVSITLPTPSSPSSVAVNSTLLLLITPLFSDGCEFLSRHSPVLV